MKISILSQHRCQLGEGPLWDPRAQCLYWIDSLGPTLYRYDEQTQKARYWELPGQSIGSLAVRDQGGLILAMDQSIYCFDPGDGSLVHAVKLLDEQSGIRLNDGKVDRSGSFLTGSMNLDPEGNVDCSLYRVGSGFLVEALLDGFQCFNGPCFSIAGDRIYLTGRLEGLIESGDYHPETGLSNLRELYGYCNPDGATVDADGFIWSAQWADQSVIRISPDGKLDRCIEVPGYIVSSVAFGGANLDKIFLTTVAAELYGDRSEAKDAGATLVITGSGYHGLPEPFFNG
ncbi:MAG: L-arabinonolactonase [Gammaproteobacteria bacterium]